MPIHLYRRKASNPPNPTESAAASVATTSVDGELIYTAKHRLIPWLTLIPTIFSFVAMVLINIGGVDPGASYSLLALTPEMNKQFNLVNWNYNINPGANNQLANTYGYHMYFNRLCSITSLADGSTTSVCRNIRDNGWVYSGRWMWAPNSFVSQLSPFQFDSINLNVPFSFCMFAALWCLVLMIPGCMGARHFSTRMVALINCSITFFLLLIAACCLTSQLDTLKYQLINNTLSPITTFTDGELISVSVDVTSVTIGSVVLGLMWGATAAMFLETIMWGIALGEAQNLEDLHRPVDQEMRLAFYAVNRNRNWLG